MKRFIILALGLLVTTLALQAERTLPRKNYVTRIESCEAIIREFQYNPATRIPTEVLQRAQTIIITNQFKAGFIFGVKDGYGVDIDKITWVLSGDEHVAEYQYPSNVVPAPEGSDLAKMLVDGEIAAGIGVGQTDSEDVKPLIANGRDAAVQYFKDKGVYPINHTVVVKDELLAANPWLAEELFNTFKAAKGSYITKLDAGADLSDADQGIVKNGKDVGGDPLPYGLAANNTTMEAIIQACVDQKVIPSKVSVEEVFAPSTVSLS